MAKQENEIQATVANVAKTGMTTWESIMADTSLTMAERVAAFQMLKGERRAAASREFTPRASICASDEDRARAEAVAPKIFAELVSEYRQIAATQDWTKAPLVSFAKVYGIKRLLDGRITKPAYGFLTFGAQDVALGNKSMADIDFLKVQGKGGRYCEWLSQLAIDYQKTFGNLSFLAKPELIKAKA